MTPRLAHALVLGLAAGILGLACPPTALAASPPTSITSGASPQNPTSERLYGAVNPNGASTTNYFEYGTTTSYGQTAPNPPVDAGASITTEVAIINGLTPETVYHYRLVAVNFAGTSVGADKTFTASEPKPTVTYGPVTSITTSTATITATVDGHFVAPTASVQYGLSSSYGATTPFKAVTFGTNSYAQQLTGLAAGTAYHYRIIATNAAGTTYGPDATFTTTAPVASSPVAPPPPTDTPASTPAPSKTSKATPTPNASQPTTSDQTIAGSAGNGPPSPTPPSPTAATAAAHGHGHHDWQWIVLGIVSAALATATALLIRRRSSR